MSTIVELEKQKARVVKLNIFSSFSFAIFFKLVVSAAFFARSQLSRRDSAPVANAGRQGVRIIIKHSPSLLVPIVCKMLILFFVSSLLMLPVSNRNPKKETDPQENLQGKSN